MSEMNPQTPQPVAPVQQPVVVQPPAEKKMSGLAVTGLVLSLVGIAVCYIPIVNNFGIACAVIGAIFALIGFLTTGKKGKRRGRVMSAISFVVAVLAIVISLVLQAQWSAALDKAQKQLDKDLSSTSLQAPQAVYKTF